MEEPVLPLRKSRGELRQKPGRKEDTATNTACKAACPQTRCRALLEMDTHQQPHEMLQPVGRRKDGNQH